MKFFTHLLFFFLLSYFAIAIFQGASQGIKEADIRESFETKEHLTFYYISAHTIEALSSASPLKLIFRKSSSPH